MSARRSYINYVLSAPLYMLTPITVATYKYQRTECVREESMYGKGQSAGE